MIKQQRPSITNVQRTYELRITQRRSGFARRSTLVKHWRASRQWHPYFLPLPDPDKHRDGSDHPNRVPCL